MKAVLVLCLLGLIALASAQVTVDFTLRMAGSCVDIDNPDFQTACTAKGNSQSVTTEISSVDGVVETVANKIGSYAVWNANLTSLVENTFIGAGNMTFGTHLRQQHTILFNSLGVGFNIPTNDTFVFSFGATFTAFGGSDGVFENAHGTITVNGYIDFYTTSITLYLNGIIYGVNP